MTRHASVDNAIVRAEEQGDGSLQRLAGVRPGADPVDIVDRVMLVAERSGRAQLAVA